MSTAEERGQQLEMRMRVARKIEDVLKAEAKAAQFDGFEAAHILGLALGLGLGSVPDDMRRSAASAHARGVEQGLQLQQAAAAMGIKPETKH